MEKVNDILVNMEISFKEKSKKDFIGNEKQIEVLLN
jgi:hypothetical protein